MPTFVGNLQTLILNKHEGTKIPQESEYVINQSSETEVVERKLPVIPPASKKGEYIFVMRLYRANEEAGVEGFCKGNFNNPESQNPEERVWGKMKIPLCSLTDTKTTLDKGLKDRQIRMGFSSSYLRKQQLGKVDPEKQRICREPLACFY